MALRVRKLDFSGKAADLSAFLDAQGIEFIDVGCVNWPNEYPYHPVAQFRFCHNSQNLLLNYRVSEEMVKAVADTDNGMVWHDSCMECFLQRPEENRYFNIECNCIGTLLIGSGLSNKDRVHVSPDALKTADRFSSLGRSPLERNEPTQWELSLVIPVNLLFDGSLKTLDGASLKGNVYKCGDSLKTPHFLSWRPISTPSPSFHEPAFFAPIEFE